MRFKLNNPQQQILRFTLLLILVPLLFIGLFFITKVSPIVTEGRIDLRENTDKTVYLFGEWRMLPSHIMPGSTSFDEASVYTINMDNLPDGIQSYSLQATIENLEPSDYCLSLYNINFVNRIYIDDIPVYNAADDTDLYEQIIELGDLITDNSFTVTVWLTGSSGRQGMLSPLTLLLTHTENAYNQSVIHIVFKYLLEGIYFAFALICLIMYLKNKSAIHFLLLSLSGIIRLLALESYLTPYLLADSTGLSESWSLRLSMILIALASTLNVGVIYTLYKNVIFKKITTVMLAITSVSLILALIFGNTLALMLNITGSVLYVLCLIAVGRAWFSNQKSAGPMFTAFLIYILSLPFFFGTRTLAGMGSVLGVYNFVCPLGELIFYAATIFAFFVRYTDSYIRSISQIQMLDLQLTDKDRSLSEAYNKLSRYEEARTRMLRDLAHDLRTPVTSVLGYLSMMASGEITGEQEVKGISSKMLLRVRQIKDMTNSISGLITLEQGELKMELQPCSVSDITETVFMHYEHRCLDAGLDFTLHNNTSVSVLVDMQQIMRVFDNLISNAIRYTPRGGAITVSAEDAGDTVRFAVWDTGCGIPEQQQPHVFGRFYRGELSRSESSTHQGLGLAICYEIIKAHNGSIGVISEYGKGSEFYFTLNRAAGGVRK